MDERVKIFDISYDGAGVGKVGDKICFVPKTLPGEVIETKITGDAGKFCVGECKKVLTKSRARIEAKCPHFDVCGGCDFQHCTYEQEQKFKRQILARELSKIGFAGEIDFVPCEQRFSYRNKVKFEVRDGKLGYFRPKTHDFFGVKTCPICDERILKVFPLAEEFLKENKLKGARNVCLKVSAGETAICFLFDKNAKIEEKNLTKTAIFEHFLIYFAFGDILESDKTKIVCVSKTREISNFDIRAFSQVNDEIAGKLYAEIAQIVGGKRVVNAYSGQGLLTKQIAGSAKFVYGIELQKSAYEKAEQVCSDCKNVKNICGRVENELQKIPDDIDLIVLDPARAGCQKAVLLEIVARKTPEITYVSCNFATLVRDLKQLKGFYEIEKVKIFDMFPCTANMETMVKLRLKHDF